MLPFVKNNIWNLLKDRSDMWCGKKKKPIIDFNIYSKNQPFRVPGSSKYVDYHTLPLPSLEFFMDTRMADRRTIPDINTLELGISKLPMDKHCYRSKTHKRSLISLAKSNEEVATKLKVQSFICDS